MNIIIDTNVFMSGIFWSGPPAKILQAWKDEKFNLVLSADILNEYMRVGRILSKKYSPIDTDEIIDLVVRRSKIYDVAPLPTSICRDVNDDMFIACALAAKIKIIVSGDLDLLELSGYHNIEVLKPRKFLDDRL